MKSIIIYMQNFQWNDETVLEFLDQVIIGRNNLDINKFKESKQHKEYEVLSYSTDGKTIFGKTWVMADCPIYSVKRLSDGEVFTIGDFIENSGYILPIQLIIIKCGKIYFECYVDRISGTFFSVFMEEAIKHIPQKQPLFKTEDGNDIFEGDKFSIISIPDYIVSQSTGMEQGIKHSDQLYFSTKEAAEQYILDNKPCLSLNDVYKSLINHPDVYIIYHSLIQKAKAKL